MEGGAGSSYSVVLTSEPLNAVTIQILSGDDVAMSPSSISFTTSNWNVLQTISISAVDDSEEEERIEYHGIRHKLQSSDPKYNHKSEEQHVIISADAANLGGTFNLVLDDHFVVADILWNEFDFNLSPKVAALSAIGTVDVIRMNEGNGYRWMITFNEHSGNISQLVPDASTLIGTNAAISIETVIDGEPLISPKSYILTIVIDNDSKGL